MTRKNTIVRYTMDEIKKMVAEGKTGSSRNPPPGPSMPKSFWKNARVVQPRVGKKSVHLRVDQDIYDWFKKRGAGHLTRMNTVLRSYIEAQEQGKRR